MARQHGAGFGLQHGDELDGPHSRFVFVAFFWRERSFRVFLGEYLEARLHTGVGTQMDQRLGDLWCEAASKGCEQTRQHCGILVGYLCHRPVSRLWEFLAAGSEKSMPMGLCQTEKSPLQIEATSVPLTI